MIDWIKNNKVYVFGGIIIACLIIYFTYFSADEAETVFENEEEWLEEPKEDISETEAVIEGEEILIVDVKGAVKMPGVYEAASGERVIDIINKAGGLKETADEAKINFAMRVVDEMVLYVPETGEEYAESGEAISSVSVAGGQDDGKINLNTADESELQTLTGIGPSKAAAIIEHRETNGPFKVIEDLKEISGIGEKTFEKLQDSIKVK